MSVNQQQRSTNQEAPGANGQTFRDLHNKYRDRLFQSMTGVVRDRDRAEDITAAAFAAAFEKLRSFRGESSFYTWLHTIALNEVKKGWRRKQTLSIEALTGPEPEALVECDVLADKLDRNECLLKLRKALRDVPVICRRALVDHFVRGYSTKQIAAREQIPVGTVLSRIFNGKRLLRRAWRS